MGRSRTNRQAVVWKEKDDNVEIETIKLAISKFKYVRWVFIP